MHLVWSYNRLCRPSALEYMPSFRYGHIYTCMIKIPIEIGDIVRVGRFKNKRIEVKTIEYDEYGLPRVNGRPLLTMRIEKLMPAKTMESMRLSTLIPERVTAPTISSLVLLADRLELFQEETNHTDWYMQGGCYSFAAALHEVLQGARIILIGDDISDLVHACVLWKGKYIDYNTMSSNIQDIMKELALQGRPKARAGKIADVSREHNFDRMEVKQIVASLTSPIPEQR